MRQSAALRSLLGTYAIFDMTFRPIGPCLALALLLGGTGAFSAPTLETHETQCKVETPLHVKIRPLADLIARGEGSWNSVNRGRAGDTPGGIQRLTGKTFDQFTVREVIEMQRLWLYAVGRYQFIPTTLRFAIRHSDVSLDQRFTPEVQDRLMAALIFYKRPAIGAYLRGDHNLLGWALNELAREWASIEYRNGRGFYDHVGGNRAHVSRAAAAAVLQQVKASWHSS